jgi:spore maturation protein A
MNVLFAILLLSGVTLMAFVSPQSLTSVMLSGTAAAVTLSLRLTGVYALWMGLMQIAEDSGIDRKLARLYRPLLSRLFKGESDRTRTLIGLNLTANLLGLGAAATPMGIAAMESMSHGEDYATDNMILFFVLNVTAIQLLPTTIIALRASHGAANPADILLPSLICSCLTAAFGMICVGLCRLLARKGALRIPSKQCKRSTCP